MQTVDPVLNIFLLGTQRNNKLAVSFPQWWEIGLEGTEPVHPTYQRPDSTARFNSKTLMCSQGFLAAVTTWSSVRFQAVPGFVLRGRPFAC